jgi:hypothetical protein
MSLRSVGNTSFLALNRDGAVEGSTDPGIGREVDENGADSENSPFLKLSILEAIQAVKDGLEGQTLQVEVDRSKDDQ